MSFDLPAFVKQAERVRAMVETAVNSWRRDHRHAEGPWCWVLTDVQRLPRAIQWRGAQGLFDVPDHAVGTAPASGPGLF